jgi:RNA polymerase sigma-70 factor (ECF subfamily)
LRLTAPQVAELVRRARRGEEAAFAELVRHHLRAVYAVALGVLGRPEDAEDIAQEAMLVAFERLETCREPERFSGWLLQIGRTRALNALASRRVRRDAARRLLADARGEAPAPGDALEREGLLAALAALTDTQREVVLLHDLDGWTHAEIAAGLEISEGMSRQHLFTARKRMRASLAARDAPTREADHG